MGNDLDYPLVANHSAVGTCAHVFEICCLLKEQHCTLSLLAPMLSSEDTRI